MLPGSENPNEEKNARKSHSLQRECILRKEPVKEGERSVEIGGAGAQKVYF